MLPLQGTGPGLWPRTVACRSGTRQRTLQGIPRATTGAQSATAKRGMTHRALTPGPRSTRASIRGMPWKSRLSGSRAPRCTELSRFDWGWSEGSTARPHGHSDHRSPRRAACRGGARQRVDDANLCILTMPTPRDRVRLVLVRPPAIEGTVSRYRYAFDALGDHGDLRVVGTRSRGSSRRRFQTPSRVTRLSRRAQ
jgi:hypothetical protein